jgi:hypothetical protein
MKKISTVQRVSNESFEGQKLTIGLDLGDRWSSYCVLDEAGKIILEQKPADKDRLPQTQMIHKLFIVMSARFGQVTVIRFVALALRARIDDRDVVHL